MLPYFYIGLLKKLDNIKINYLDKINKNTHKVFKLEGIKVIMHTTEWKFLSLLGAILLYEEKCCNKNPERSFSLCIIANYSCFIFYISLDDRIELKNSVRVILLTVRIYVYIYICVCVCVCVQ